ncbi:hypothetical protein GCM10011488_10040 [Steroidobacter agaridevorans]|nr:hypothetical protein GCM10011488_10040 [Steroidobacter agaridevorans]
MGATSEAGRSDIDPVTTEAGNRFVLEVVDPATGCIVYDAEVHDLLKLCKVLDLDPAEMEPGADYEFDAAQMALIIGALGLEHAALGITGVLRPWGRLDQLPYKVHTNRELLMMLAGTKPLAVFHDCHPSRRPPFEVIPENFYAPYVESGRFIMREVIAPSTDPRTTLGVRTVLYALPTEQWRIDAYLLLRQTGFKYGWSETCERMEGSLLGYTDEQNDIFIERIYRTKV